MRNLLSLLICVPLITVSTVSMGEELLDLPGMTEVSTSFGGNSTSALTPKELMNLYESEESLESLSHPESPAPAATTAPAPAPQPAPQTDSMNAATTPPTATSPDTHTAQEEPVVTPPNPPATTAAANEGTANQETKPEKSIAEEIADNIDTATAGTADIIEKTVREQEYNLNKVWDYPSLMLSPRESIVLSKAISSYLRSRNLPPSPLPDGTTTPDPPVITKKDYPFIVVDSIIYRAPDDWTLWINRTRYTPEKPESLSGIQVESVSANSVKIRWTRMEVEPANVQIIDAPDIQPATSEPSSAKLESLPNNQYLITLSANQVFITSDTSFHEGRVVNAKIAEIIGKIQKQKATAQLSSTQGGIPLSESDRENVEKLMNLYQNAGVDFNKTAQTLSNTAQGQEADAIKAAGIGVEGVPVPAAASATSPTVHTP